MAIDRGAFVRHFCQQMRTATVRDAQHHLTRLLAAVVAGEEIVLTRRGKQVGKLVPMDKPEDPFEQAVDWSESIRERDENLDSLPQFQGDILAEMREDERY
jgi:prevent-host-death family protein